MKHPLFRTLAPGKAAKTPLPQQKMQTGLATLAEAMSVQAELSEHFYTALGKDETGYYVEAPDAATLAYLVATEA